MIELGGVIGNDLPLDVVGAADKKVLALEYFRCSESMSLGSIEHCHILRNPPPR